VLGSLFFCRLGIRDRVAKKKAAESTRGSYQQRKERERARQAEQARAGRELGVLPRVADPQRRRKAHASLRTFAETYFPERFTLAWSPDHLRVIERMEKTILSGGRQAFAMPRGSGKTTLAEIGVLWAVLTGRRNYVALVGASKPHSDELLDSIRGELEANELLAADFPEVCVPISALEGIHNRAKGQLHQGTRTQIRWAGATLVLPTIRLLETELPEERRRGRQQPLLKAGELTPASAAIICVRGITGRIRGMKFRRPDGETVRPDLCIVDDPQTDTSARSVTQCTKRLRILTGAILGLAGPGQTIAVFVPCTVIVPGDMADQLLDREEHPEYHGERTKLVYEWPRNAALWEEYAELRRADLASGGDGSPATKFYRKNKRAMDAGSKVAWPARHLPEELSALQHAMNLRIDSPDTFDAEYQNEPVNEDDQQTIVPELADLCARVSAYKRGQIPAAVERLTWFVDVHANLLYWGVVGWAPGFTGWLVDYGTWPDQRSTYFTLRDARHPISKDKRITATTLEGQVSQALDQLFQQLGTRTWTREDRLELSLDLGMCDANWGDTTDQVYEACRLAKTKYGLKVLPSHGAAYGPSKCPISRYKAKSNKGSILGDEWMIPPVARKRTIRAVIFDANRRKSFLFRRLCTPIGDPGSLVFFHAKPHEHKLLGEHLTAEKPKEVSGPYGDLTEFALVPGRDNHWLDVLVGCCTCESIAGGKLIPAVIPAEKPEKKPEAKAKVGRTKRKKVAYLE
jgi:hypothetical protein